MRRPGPDQREADTLESLRQVQHQRHLHFHNLTISTKITHSVCWAPPFRKFVASQSTRYFCCHFATSGLLNASHQRINDGISAIGLSLVTCFGIRKNIVVQACCGYLLLCSTFSKNSTIPPLVSFVKSKGEL